MWSIFLFGLSLLIAICVVILLTVPAIFVYKFLLKKIHPLYSLLLLVYPVILYVFGNRLVDYGEKLNLQDLTSRMEQGEDTHIFSIDAGTSSVFWGYSFLIGAVTVVFVVLVIIILRFIKK
ncbi:hypothetical protein [Jeotgalibacillus campisalis]|nr:hypothetical protein [Jeotgalibacillus campisalis]